MRRGARALFIFLIVVPPAEATTRVFRYRVREADSLDSVLNRWGACPLWGPEGSLSKTVELNPKLRRRKGLMLVAGEIILLPPVLNLDHGSRNPRSLVRLPNKVDRSCADVSSSLPLRIASRGSGRAPASTHSYESSRSADETLGPRRGGQFSQIFLGTAFDYQRLALVDQESLVAASFLSDLNPSLYLRWDMNWDEQLRSYLKVSYQWFYLVQPFNRVIENQGHLMGSLEAFVERIFEIGLSLGAGLGFGQQLEIATRANGDLFGVKLMVPDAFVASRVRLVSLNNFQFGLGSRGGLSFPINGAGYRVDMGHFYSGELWFQHEALEGWALEGSVSLSRRKFNTPLNTHDGMALGFLLGVGRKF